MKALNEIEINGYKIANIYVGGAGDFRYITWWEKYSCGDWKKITGKIKESNIHKLEDALGPPLAKNLLDVLDSIVYEKKELTKE